MPNRNRSPFSRQKPPAGSQIDWSNPLTRNLETFLPLNEGGGLSFRDMASGRPGTFAVGATPITWQNQGLSYPGVSASYALVSNVKDIRPPTTIVLSFTPSGADLTSDPWLFSHDNGGNFGYAILSISGKANFRFHGTANYASTVSLVNGQKTFLACTVDKNGGTATFYVGIGGTWQVAGVAIGSEIATASTRTTLASNLFGSDIYTGLFDYLYHYSRVLSPSEIQQIYQEPYAIMRGPSRSSGKVAA
jgi:hypothetical protein